MSSQQNQIRGVGAKVEQLPIQAQKRITFPSATTTSKYKKTPMLKTLDSSPLNILPSQIGGNPHRTLIPAQDYSYEKQTKKDLTISASLENPIIGYNANWEQNQQLNHSNLLSDYNTTGAGPSFRSLGTRGGQPQQNHVMKQHQEQIQQYSSIPVKLNRETSQNKTQQLVKMYGGGGVVHMASGTSQGQRKQVKSVERRGPDRWRNYKNVINIQQQTQFQNLNLSKQGSQNLKNALELRKYSGAGINKSMLTAFNIYDSANTLNTSQESIKFNNKRNAPGSSIKRALQLYTSSQDPKNVSQQRKVSSKSLQGRYNQIKQRQTQPLEEIRNLFNIHNSNQNILHNLSKQNITITNNDSYQDMSNRNNQSKSKINPMISNYQTVSLMNNSSVGSSSRKTHYKDFQQHQLPSSIEVPSTETVMFLRKQEIVHQSDQVFNVGKQFLNEKNYKEAIRSFTSALKINQYHKEAKYYRAICYLDSGNLKKCIQDLNELLDIDPSYNKTIYIVLSIAYRRDQDMQNSLKILTKGIQKFPKYVEAYQARGQIQIFLKKWDKALIDFQNVIQLQPTNGSGYIGQADSLKGLGNFKGAIQSYNQAIERDKSIHEQVLTKRGVLQYQLKNYELAFEDFQNLLQKNDKNPRAHYFKGKILKKQANYNDAMLHFEQVLKNNTDDQLSGSALFEIAKIRIKQKDFYEAYHNLQRALHFDYQSKKFIQYKQFTEGVLFIMKRKVKKGIKILCQLVDGVVTIDQKDLLNNSMCGFIQSYNFKFIKLNCTPITLPQKAQEVEKEQKEENSAGLKSYLIYLIYVYRSYGYIKALTDLNKAAKIRKLDQACVYNKFIVQALIKIDKKDFEGVRKILQQAEIKFPQNKDPFKFQAIAIVQGCASEVVDIDNPKKKSQMLESKEMIDKALLKSPKDPNLLYLRGLILFYMHSFYEALIDLDAVIDLEEEPNAKHYLARGRCHACLSMFQEAINDLAKAIELDDELSDAYFNRGKCAYLLGDTALAFLDFQKLILLEPKNPMVHIYAGNLLMTTGSYEDATKAFTNADSVQKSSLAFFQRARCFIALANLDNALKDLTLVVERTPSDKIAQVDKECLNALKIAISSVNFPGSNTSTPLSKTGFDPQCFEKAIVIYTKLLNNPIDIEKQISQTTSAMRMHQQIIPNVKRIKLEKMRALRRKRAKEEYLQSCKKSKRKNIFFINDDTDQKLDQQAKKVEPFSYYKENIFGSEDFYLFRGIMHFYIGDYQKAIQDFEDSIKAKQEQKDDQNEGDNVSHSSSQTDLSDVGLCSLNVHESSYNILLCHIMLKDYTRALNKMNQLIHDSPKKYSKHLWLIRGLIYQALGSNNKAKLDFEQALKLDHNLSAEFLNNKSNIVINPFPIGNRLCCSFPEIKFQLNNAPTYFFSRPSFSFPFVKPPNMIPNVDEKVLITEFDMKNLAAPKPEAPWIKRCDYGIKFTDEIQVIDNPLSSDTEESTIQHEDEPTKSKEEGESDDHDEEEDNDVDYNHNRIESEMDERHYLRNYVKSQKVKLMSSFSEQILKNEFNFFKEFQDPDGIEEEEGHDDDSEDGESQNSQNQQDSNEDEEEEVKMFKENLYGKVEGDESNEKNIIVDDDNIVDELDIKDSL